MKILDLVNEDNMPVMGETLKQKLATTSDEEGDDALTYAQAMGKYIMLENEQYTRTLNLKKKNEFDKISKLFPLLTEYNLMEFNIEYSEDNLSATVTFTVERLYGSVLDFENCVGKVLSMMFITYPDFRANVNENNLMEWNFFVPFYNEELTLDNGEELKELNEHMKELSRRNRQVTT